MICRAQMLYHIATHLGIGWLGYRFAHALAMKSGYYRMRHPRSPWDSHPLRGYLRASDASICSAEEYCRHRAEHPARFFFSPGSMTACRGPLQAFDGNGNSPAGLCDDLKSGIFEYFSHEKVRTGFPPVWNRNPFSGQSAPENIHWSKLSDFEYGDIKTIWEPGRFGFAYSLVRAYWRTGDESYPEMFWKSVEDWRLHNPPNSGVNWKCGQETAFRLMAWCFGLYAFLKSPSTTPERVEMLAQMTAVSAERIESNISYALSQNNNHGISEGLGLWTAGILFPEFKHAEKWLRLGKKVLITQCRKLIYEDGSFSQHSMNYHRVMLHDYIWCIRLGQLNGHDPGKPVIDAVERAADFLYQVQDEVSGRVPNYGANDGALVLPLNNCDYTDFRPVIQAGRYLAHGTRCYERGPWDEDLLWLFGADALDAPVEPMERKSWTAPEGGYHTLRSRDGFVFTRCGEFRHRPSHADTLHADIWWKGINVACDAGSFSYNAPPPWDNPLAGTAFHNTVSVDGRDQMEKAGRFLWLPWVKGKRNGRGMDRSGNIEYWEGEHDGYKRLLSPVWHGRAIIRVGTWGWVVLDRLSGTTSHTYTLSWLFPDAGCEWNSESGELSLSFEPGRYHVTVGSSSPSVGHTLKRADPSGPQGWISPCYYSKREAISLQSVCREKTCWFWTVFSEQGFTVTWRGNTLSITGDTSPVEILLSGGSSMIERIRYGENTVEISQQGAGK